MKHLKLVVAGTTLASAVALCPNMSAFGSVPASVPSAVQARSQALAAAQAGADDNARKLGLDSDEKLVVKDVITDANGTKHVRYNRTFKGLRVIGGDFVSHNAKSGDVKSVSWNGSGKNVAVDSTTPSVSKSNALAAGKRTAIAEKSSAASSQGELVVYAGNASGPRLAYDVLTTGVKADQTPSRLHTYVDAETGAVLGTNDEIVEGTGNGIYVGQVSIGTTGSSGAYTMKDSVGNYTTDLNGATSGNGTTFTDSDDVWGTGSNSNRQSAAVDAHYGAEKTFDYYKNVQGRNGIWNNGTGARSRVHYGSNYVNAFWDGTQMTYGDGSGNSHPLTELDVSGHEMSHGVTENTAGLNYSGDAGGLNEATSDIFGTAVEFYANNPKDVPDYLIGEVIDLNGNGTPLRYMDKPSKDGGSKDCWSSSVGGLDPHYSSGPLNHWFYLASEGSGAKTINGVSYNSPTCNGSTVTGISRDKAAKIWYRTLSTYLTSTSNYAAARNGAIKSAKDLYGSGSAECTGVANAFSAISVPAGTETCGTSGPTDPPPTGSNLVANGGFESGATSWTGTSGPITNDSGRPAHAGSWKLWLGGNGSTASESEQQNVTIPSTAASASLTYWVRTDTAESGSTAYDTAKVQVISGTTTSTLASYSNVGTNSTYSQKTFDLSAYKGKTITLKFLANEDSSLQTSFVFDDVAVNAG
ncbi:M4 family metallopeptidase [Luteipulveratus sp. YIM 133132]|uniref:Neutral metalloproteinase n=1 Tax=Luteipulveratus flavus TaxID=3031728 RepID=A0ABT6C9U7_9MICO|nr:MULTISPECIES: M4 family metallopeptidase [unclassified Luteipulveratus]MDE9366199.1 M4 family metallopeptidase [Luteipulveratus sp. YIM 133132]MDF8265288.1 M4 family metallopeptidase [Luteipulveratus sp. YIM 133296]